MNLYLRNFYAFFGALFGNCGVTRLSCGLHTVAVLLWLHFNRLSSLRLLLHFFVALQVLLQLTLEALHLETNVNEPIADARLL